MYIEYPPMLSGDGQSQLNQLRSYLFRVTDSLNFLLTEAAKAEDEAKEEKEVKDEAVLSIPKGSRLIARFTDGWTVGHNASEALGANLVAVNDFYLFYAVVSGGDGLNPVIVPLFRHGNLLKGSSTAVVESDPITFMIEATVLGNDITLKSARYAKLGEDGTSWMTLPGLTGYNVRQLYAIIF